MNLKLKQTFSTIILLVILTSCTNAPTQTTVPDFTATAKPAFAPTLFITDTPSPTNTPEIKTAVLDESTSPDETWHSIVSLTTQGRNKNLFFKVISNTNNQEWIIEQIDINKIETPPPGGFIYPYLFKWSKDKNYMYFSHLSTGGDGCYGLNKPGGIDLKKFNLATGESTTISQDGGTWMALSPDETNLAYVHGWGGDVSILSISNGKNKTFPLPPIKNELKMATDTSYIYWSPDGNSLIYAHLVGACDFITPYSNIIQIYPSTKQQKFLVENDEHGYVPDEWNVQDKILLSNNENNKWWLNPTTKEITPAQ